MRLVTAENRFFGPSVTVSGLLTGGDILRALSGKRSGDIVVVPSNALKEDEDLFLDGMHLAGLEQRLGVKILAAEGFAELVAVLAKGGKDIP